MAQRRLSMRAWRGFSLIEAAIVLAIVGLVIGGIWVAASAVYTTMKVNQTASATLVMINNARKLIGRNFDATCTQLGCGYNVNITGLLKKAGGVPGDFNLKVLTELDPGGDGLATPMGKDMVVAIGDWTSFGHITTGYAIIVLGLEKASCIRIVTAITGRFQNNRDLMWVETDASTGTGTFPISIATANTLCSNVSPSNFLIFYFSPL